MFLHNVTEHVPSFERHFIKHQLKLMVPVTQHQHTSFTLHLVDAKSLLLEVLQSFLIISDMQSPDQDLDDSKVSLVIFVIDFNKAFPWEIVTVTNLCTILSISGSASAFFNQLW